MCNVIEAEPGTSIYKAAEDAINKLKEEKTFKDGKLRFNNLLVPFSIKSDSTDIAIIYNLMSENRRLKVNR